MEATISFFDVDFVHEDALVGVFVSDVIYQVEEAKEGVSKQYFWHTVVDDSLVDG